MYNVHVDIMHSSVSCFPTTGQRPKKKTRKAFLRVLTAPPAHHEAPPTGTSFDRRWLAMIPNQAKERQPEGKAIRPADVLVLNLAKSHLPKTKVLTRLVQICKKVTVCFFPLSNEPTYTHILTYTQYIAPQQLSVFIDQSTSRKRTSRSAKTEGQRV